MGELKYPIDKVHQYADDGIIKRFFVKETLEKIEFYLR